MTAHRQAGATLIVSLVLLLVVTVTGATALRITSVQETATSGQRYKTISLMAAEAGASATWAAFNGQANWWVNLPGHGSNAAAAVGSNNTGYWTVANPNSLAASGGTIYILGVARNGSDGQELARSKVRLDLSVPAGGGLPDVLNRGILAGTKLDFSGKTVTVTGSIKSNTEILGQLTLTSGSTAYYASGSAPSGSTQQAAYNPWGGTDTSEYTRNSALFKADLDVAAASSGGCKTSAGVALPTATSNDLGGKVYYCNSAVTLASGRTYSNGTIIGANTISTSSNLYNMKVVAANTVYHYAGAVGSSAQPTTLVSTNDIIHKFSGTAYGAFWAGKTLKDDSGSTTAFTVRGCMFAGNDILHTKRNSTFIEDDSACGAQLGTPAAPTIALWREVID